MTDTAQKRREQSKQEHAAPTVNESEAILFHRCPCVDSAFDWVQKPVFLGWMYMVLERDYERHQEEFGIDPLRQQLVLDATIYGINWLQAFAIEMWLKALIATEGKSPPTHGRQGHDLCSLFGRVSKGARADLAARYFQITSRGLHGVLKERKHDFQDWRYLTGNEPECTDRHIADLRALGELREDRILQVCSCGANPNSTKASGAGRVGPSRLLGPR